MTGSLPVFALIRIYWALITELRPANIVTSCDEHYGKPPHLLHSRPWPQTHTWPSGGMGGRWTVVSRAWTYFDSAGCLLSLCLLYWSVIVIHDHVTSYCEAFHSHTYLEFVDLLRRLLTKINRCHACLVSTLHWAPAPSRAGHTLCGQTFHSSSSISNTTGIWREKIHGFILISYHRTVKICLATRK